MNASSLKVVALAALIGLGVSVSACKKKDEQGPVDKTSEAVKDGLDMRENEPVKDAAEDVKDAAQDAGEAVQEGAEEAKDKAQDAAQ